MRLSLRGPGMDGDGALGSGDCLQSRADPEREAVSHTASDHKRNRLKGVLLHNLLRLYHKEEHHITVHS
jgi:hypothetical protein